MMMDCRSVFLMNEFLHSIHNFYLKNHIMDADPLNWNKSCEAARQLRHIKTYKAKTVHTLHSPFFTVPLALLLK